MESSDWNLTVWEKKEILRMIEQLNNTKIDILYGYMITKFNFPDEKK